MNKLTKGQFSILSIFLITSPFLYTSSLLINILNQESYIGILITYFIGFIPLFIYYKLLNYNKKGNIINLINDEFIFGKIINILLLIFMILYASFVLFNIVDFVHFEYLYETPKSIISILFLICILYIVNKDITVIGRCATIIILICLLLFLIATSTLFFKIDLSNLKPFFEHNVNDIIKSSTYILIYSILPLFLLLIIPKDNIISNKNLSKTFIICYTLSFIFMFIAMFYCITILGNLVNIYKYPFHQLMIVAKDLRCEAIISTIWIFSNIITLSLIMYFIKTSIASFKINNNIIYIISLLILFISNSAYLNIIYVLIFIFFFILPFIIYIKLKS